jgi:hypothetical protein
MKLRRLVEWSKVTKKKRIYPLDFLLACQHQIRRWLIYTPYMSKGRKL